MDRYTQKAQDALVAAQGLAHAANHSSIEPLHILLALVRQPEGVVPAILTKIAGSHAMLQEEVERDLDKLPTMVGGQGQPGLSRAAQRVLEAAEQHA